jgi:heat-inducible transcriptional repressor
MQLSERQNLILGKIVEDYINSAKPVSSQFLEEEYDFDISPATIRIEMQKLTDGGYLFQPHTSAGRVPTDKAYRLLVDRLFEDELSKFDIEESDIRDWFEKEIENTFKFIQSLTKHLALASSALALSYLSKEKFLWKEGWEEILKEPEFNEREQVINFTEFLNNFEENIEKIKADSGIKIYIGKENIFPKAKDFAVISSKFFLPEEGETILALLGPKRMAYSKNISLIKSLTEFLKDFE